MTHSTDVELSGGYDNLKLRILNISDRMVFNRNLSFKKEGVLKRFLAFAPLAIAFATPGMARAATDSCSTDWQKRVIKCKGNGAPNLDAPTIAVARLGAERAAKADALRNILEAIRGVKVDGNGSAGDLLKKDPALTAKVQGVAKNFKVTDTRYFSDGGVEVDVEMTIDAVADALIPPKPEAAKAEPAKVEPSKKSDEGPTGLIIDASAVKPAPALAPRVLDETGAEVYGPGSVSAHRSGVTGYASYARDVDAARKDGRVKDKPMVVKALRLASAGSPDVVISAEDAAKLKGATALSDGRVVIVIP